MPALLFPLRMYGLHLFILPSCGCVSFTVHRSSLSVSVSLPPTTLVCLPSSCLLCILHLSTSLHTCCHAGTLAWQHGWMPGQFRCFCFVQRRVLLECNKMQTERFCYHEMLFGLILSLVKCLKKMREVPCKN